MLAAPPYNAPTVASFPGRWWGLSGDRGGLWLVLSILVRLLGRSQNGWMMLRLRTNKWTMFLICSIVYKNILQKDFVLTIFLCIFMNISNDVTIVKEKVLANAYLLLLLSLIPFRIIQL